MSAVAPKFTQANVGTSREVFEQFHKIWIQMQIFDPSNLPSKESGGNKKKKKKESDNQ